MYLECFATEAQALAAATKWSGKHGGDTAFVIHSPHQDRPEHPYCATNDGFVRNWEMLLHEVSNGRLSD